MHGEKRRFLCWHGMVATGSISSYGLLFMLLCLQIDFVAFALLIQNGKKHAFRRCAPFYRENVFILFWVISGRNNLLIKGVNPNCHKIWGAVCSVLKLWAPASLSERDVSYCPTCYISLILINRGSAILVYRNQKRKVWRSQNLNCRYSWCCSYFVLCFHVLVHYTLITACFKLRVTCAAWCNDPNTGVPVALRYTSWTRNIRCVSRNSMYLLFNACFST